MISYVVSPHSKRYILCIYSLILFLYELTTGFLPLEPSMGGVEACKGSCCHGALMQMTAKEYQTLWISEGGGIKNPGE